MKCCDEEINVIEWMYALNDELWVETLRLKFSCLIRCLVPHEALFSTQNTKDITKT